MASNQQYSKYTSPLRYPGGKASIYPFVQQLIKSNGLESIGYAEPYAGGAGLALKLLFEDDVKQVYLNDLDRALYSFWYCATEMNSFFCDWINHVKVNMKTWRFYKNIYSNADDYSNWDLARATFFLNRTNVSGVLTGGVIGGLNQEGKYKIDARFNKEDLINRMRRIGEYADKIHISQMDGLKFISKMNYKREDIFIYLDPPYVEKGAKLYMNFYKSDDHKALSKKIRASKQYWMVSYDNHPQILKLYRKHKKIVYKLSQSTSNRIGDEIIILSDKLEFGESTEKLKSAELLV